MDAVLFYSWQSDQDERTCRYLIRDAAERAISGVQRSHVSLELSPRLEHDTQGQPGMPDITATILGRIQKAHFYLADLTFVAETAEHKKVPNPNVLLELGYAIRSLGWDRVICVMNEHYGIAGEQIFNIRARRWPLTYNLTVGSDVSTARSEIKVGLERAINSIITADHAKVREIASRLDSNCLCFLNLYYQQDSIQPPQQNTFTLGSSNGLDTPGFNVAVTRLLDMSVIECGFNNEVRSYFYRWTYLGRLLIEQLSRGTI